MRQTIVIDFDGTIVDHEFPEIGKLKLGVKEALSELIKDYDIVISSCRNNPEVNRFGIPFKEMKKFLDQEGIPYTYLDDGKHGKVAAHAYIDDKAIRFDDVENSWGKILYKLSVAKSYDSGEK